MIEFLTIISFLAIAGYGVVVAWPHLRWSALTSRGVGGQRRQYDSARPARIARPGSPRPQSAPRFRETAATAGLYSRRSEEFVRRGASASDGLARDLAGIEKAAAKRD